MAMRDPRDPQGSAPVALGPLQTCGERCPLTPWPHHTIFITSNLQNPRHGHHPSLAAAKAVPTTSGR